MLEGWTTGFWRVPPRAVAGVLVLSGLAACAIDSRSPGDASCAVDDTCSSPGGDARAGAGGAGTTAEGAGTSAMGGTGVEPLDADRAPVAGAGAAGAATAGMSSDGVGGASLGAGGSPGTDEPSGAGGAASSTAGAGSSAASCPTNLLRNGGFEAGSEPWQSFSTGEDPLVYDARVEVYDGVDPHAGSFLGWLGGVPSETNRLSQTVSVPANATALGLSYSLRVQIFEEHPNVDFFRVRLVVAGQTLPIAEFTNADASDDWVNLSPPPVSVTTNGAVVSATLELESEIGAGPGTNFFVDDLALVPTCTP
ncbi:MAG TPA: hypothetical protein VMG12_44455 [Polyangiaceae bacterium]|nr:hypothetical protein [Polyangiaceae bacterium]